MKGDYYIYKDVGWDKLNVIFICQGPETLSEADILYEQFTGKDPKKQNNVGCVIVNSNGPYADWLEKAEVKEWIKTNSPKSC